MSKLSRLSIKQMRILAALIKDGNVSHVADQIGLTQQAVSANLATLRDIFKDPLFIRTGRGVTPTALALELAGEVSAILLSLEKLVERAPFDPAQATGVIKISAADYAHRFAVVPRLRAIREQAPKLKIIMSELEVDALAVKMATSEIDIVVSIPEFVPEDWPRKTLFQEHYVCVTASGSPLAKRKMSLAKLSQQSHIVVSPARANLIGSADGWLKQLGWERNIVMSVPHFLLLPEVIEATGAVAFVPSRLLPHPRLAALKLDGDVAPPGYDLIIAWHPRSATSPLVNWLVRMLGPGDSGKANL